MTVSGCGWVTACTLSAVLNNGHRYSVWTNCGEIAEGLYVCTRAHTLGNCSGETFISGPQFARPLDIEHEPSRAFVQQELFGVDGADQTVSLTQCAQRLARCVILTLKDYQSSMFVCECRNVCFPFTGRSTEIADEHVYCVQYKVAGQTPASAHTPCSLQQPLPTGQAVGGGVKDSSAPPFADGADSESSGMQSPVLPGSHGMHSVPMAESSCRLLKKLKVSVDV
jgi:hypothetical protein